MVNTGRDREKFFRFLRRLRSEGRTNMYGAVPYLMRSFAVDRDTAFRMVCDWLDEQLTPDAIQLTPQPRKSRRNRAA